MPNFADQEPLQANERRTRDHVLIAASIPIGWTLYDLTLFMHSGEPGLVFQSFTPDALAFALVFACVGALVARWRLLLPVLVVVLGVLSVLPKLTTVSMPHAQIWLPRALLIMVVTLGVTARLQACCRLGALRTGLAAGLVACFLKTTVRFEFPAADTLWMVALAAAVAFVLGAVRSALMRRGATLLVVVIPAAMVAARVQAVTEFHRKEMSPPTAQAAEGSPNLILIVLDTVRADRLATYGYERVTTPGLDAFASSHATVYTQARSTSPFTLASHGSLFTGLFPAEHGAAFAGRSARPIRTDVPTLAQILRDRGYQTSAILANTVYLSPYYGLDRGFEHFDDRHASFAHAHLALAQMTGRHARVGHLSHRDATSITDVVLDWVDNDRRPGAFFLMINYLDAHSPYHPPAPYDAEFSDLRPVDPLNPGEQLHSLLYDRELKYLDSQVTRLLDGLEERNLFDGTVIAITSDHGESLGEHGIPAHCWNLYEGLVHVPLFVKPAAERTEASNDDRISSVGTFELLLREVGIDVQPHAATSTGFVGEWYPWSPLQDTYLAMGERMGANMERNVVAWIEGSLKTIVSSDGGVERYDLNADPSELEPLELSADEIEAALGRALDWWTAHPVEGSEAELDDDLRARMGALGYGS